jgi:hypothetical protein
VAVPLENRAEPKSRLRPGRLFIQVVLFLVDAIIRKTIVKVKC